MGIEALAIAAIATTVISTGMGVMGQLQAGRSEKEWSEYNARVLDNEAVIARQQAAAEAEQQRKQGERIKGAQRALFAKAGVDLSSGSPLDVLEETAAETDLAMRSIRWAGDMQARRALSAASAERIKGSSAERLSYWGAGTTFLTGLGRATTQGYNYQATYGKNTGSGGLSGYGRNEVD